MRLMPIGIPFIARKTHCNASLQAANNIQLAFSPTSYKIAEFIVVGQKTQQRRMGGETSKGKREF